LETLRQLVVVKIRESIATESDVNNLDLKIALLVKNRISLEEVVHYTTKQMKNMLSSNESVADKDVESFNLKGTDRENRERKVRYEQLFYLLQTQPQYLTRLMYLMNQKSGASVTRFLEQTVLTLFGYAQNNREEYLLLNLIEVEYLSYLMPRFDLSFTILGSYQIGGLLFDKTRGLLERQSTIHQTRFAVYSVI
jgi:predicted HTH domain antitoxin